MTNIYVCLEVAFGDIYIFGGDSAGGGEILFPVTQGEVPLSLEDVPPPWLSISSLCLLCGLTPGRSP